jgi:hypothetical protein
MTKRVTVSLPDDEAEVLDALPGGQVSAYVAEALRRRRVSDAARAALAAAGHRDFPYDPAGAAERLAAGRVGAGLQAAAIGRVAALTGQQPAAVAVLMGADSPDTTQ